jgi:hypothetical protein
MLMHLPLQSFLNDSNMLRIMKLNLLDKNAPAPTLPRPLETTLPPTLSSEQLSRGLQSSSAELTKLEQQHRSALETQQVLLQETLKKQRALEEQLRTQQKLIEQTLLAGKGPSKTVRLAWAKEPVVTTPQPAPRLSEADQGSGNSKCSLVFCIACFSTIFKH